jgi:hypothetical protein
MRAPARKANPIAPGRHPWAAQHPKIDVCATHPNRPVGEIFNANEVVADDPDIGRAICEFA